MKSNIKQILKLKKKTKIIFYLILYLIMMGVMGQGETK